MFMHKMCPICGMQMAELETIRRGTIEYKVFKCVACSHQILYAWRYWLFDQWYYGISGSQI